MENEKDFKTDSTMDSDLQELLKSEWDNGSAVGHDIPELITIKQELDEGIPEFINNVGIVKGEPMEALKSETESKPLSENSGSVQESIKPEEIHIKSEETQDSSLSDFVIKKGFKNSADRLNDQCRNGTGPENFPTGNLPQKSVKEVTVFKCQLCDFTTIRKHRLKEHSVIHKDPEEVDSFQCLYCDFRTIHKHSLNRHLLTHKNPTELNWYRCDHCEFQTFRKSSLKTHLLIHREPEEVAWFHCDHCKFRTIRKRGMQDHLLIHKDPKDLEWFECNDCSFRTIRKRHLQRHILLHSNPLSCNQCKYKTIDNAQFKQHIRQHENASKVGRNGLEKNVNDKFTCEKCTYSTNKKSDLKKHVVRIHSSLDDRSMLSCDKCEYQTIHMDYFRRHQKRLHNSSWIVEKNYSC